MKHLFLIYKEKSMNSWTSFKYKTIKKFRRFKINNIINY